MLRTDTILTLISEMARRPDDDLALGTLAERAGLSRFQLHRAFARVAGETPKAFAQRLRLDRAAAALAADRNGSVLEIALAHGFGSHEVFLRAFRRQFGMLPQDYRRRTLRRPAAPAARHAELVGSAGPCIRLYRMPATQAKGRPAMSTSPIERKDLEEQPILFIRRRIPSTELQTAMGECFPLLFNHGQQAGLTMVGPPLTRYTEMGPGHWTIECAMPFASPGEAAGEITPGTLPAGPVATAVHTGSYDGLGETYVALEKWMEENGVKPGGAPWESYLTDPGEVPNPAEWQTAIYWPITE